MKNSILKGALGNKRNIHIAASPLPEKVYDDIEDKYDSDNEKLQAFAGELDKVIWKNYKLWPTNYIAYDLYHKTDKYKDRYDTKELRHFERRLEVRVDLSKQMEVDSFLLMYANPVLQAEKL